MTLAIAAVAIVLEFAPAWTAALSYEQDAIASGEVWRLVTGHITHWNSEHLLWDVVMFGALAGFVERRNRASAARLLIGSVAFISLGLWFGIPQVLEYRGLSGVDSALFTYAAMTLVVDAFASRRPALAAVGGLLLIGFVGKISYELATGATLFVDASAAGFTPLPLVHIVGAAAGILFAAIDARRSSAFGVCLTHESPKAMTSSDAIVTTP